MNQSLFQGTLPTLVQTRPYEDSFSYFHLLVRRKIPKIFSAHYICNAITQKRREVIKLSKASFTLKLKHV